MAQRHDGIVLVLTNPCDEVADRVVGELRNQGAQIARFDPAELPQRSTLTMDVGTKRMSGTIYRSWGPSIDLQEIRSAWYRRPSDFVIPRYQHRQTAQFAHSELTAALSGALRSLDCFWMNHPGAITEANYKVEQLVRAERLGMRTPSSCVTNQPAEARAFFRAHDGQVIIKALGDPLVYSPGEGPSLTGMIFTSLLPADAISKFDRVQDAPVLLQRHIKKRADIRATIVQDSIFAVSIDSQGNPQSIVDWRQVGSLLPHTVVKLPDELERQLIMLTKSYGLSFACVDLVLSDDGDHVFLELNPIGEWGWVERVTGLKITDSIVSALLTGHTAERRTESENETPLSAS